MKHIGLFAAGVLFGTAGLKILGSKDAKKVYAHTTAAVLRAKDCVMKAATTVREGAGGHLRRCQGHQRSASGGAGGCCRGRRFGRGCSRGRIKGYPKGRTARPYFFEFSPEDSII